MVSPESLILPARYRLRRHIATGGMASVWCAEDLVLGRNVAIKVLAERLAYDQLAMARFTREARAAARASSHPHVVTVYDVGELEGDPDRSHAGHTLPGRAFIVMEFLAGGTVADAIRHNSVSRQESMRWLREAASALDHAHERGIVHRDIKPANFLLDRSRSLHVADFGIARLTTEETITTSDQLFGTAAYLSPEQALGREATGASDRYALAVAAFELLVGERPFSAPHFSSQARQHIEEPPPAASECNRLLPAAVDDVFFEALAKRPQDRPPSAGRLVSALADALDGVPSDRGGGPRRGRGRSARPVDPAAPVPSTAAAQGSRSRSRPDTTRSFSAPAGAAPHRRRRMLAFGSLGVLVLVLAGIAVAALHGGGTPHVTVQADRTPQTHHHAAPAPTKTTPVTHTTRTATTSTTTTTTTPVVTAAQLQLQGHNEMLAGDYTTAIPTLQQALAADPTTTTKAYALYDLGRSMVLSGQASQAIPILRQRLQIPNQTATVQAMLDQAYADAAKGSAPSDGTVSAPQTTTTGSAPNTGGAAPTTGATTSTPATPPSPPPTTTTPPTGSSPPAPGPAGSGGAGLPGSGTSTINGDDIAAHRHRPGHRHGGSLGSFLHAVLAVAR